MTLFQLQELLQLVIIQLIDIIVRIYGTESIDKEDSTVEMSGVKIKELLNELLTPEVVTLATGVTNCPNAIKVLQCVYKTGEGMVYIVER